MHKGIIIRKAMSAEDWNKQAAQLKPEKQNIIIEKVIELTENKFDNLNKNFITDNNYVKENTELMYLEYGVWHMVAFNCKNRDSIICAECEGFGYLRYTSILTTEEYEKPYLNSCFCPKCDLKESCIHNEAYRRMPKEIGGLALCPKLNNHTDPKREV